MEFVPVRCPECGAVVMDCFQFRGIVRQRCKCRRRVWIQGDGCSASVIRVDKRPDVLK